MEPATTPAAMATTPSITFQPTVKYSERSAFLCAVMNFSQSIKLGSSLVLAEMIWTGQTQHVRIRTTACTMPEKVKPRIKGHSISQNMAKAGAILPAQMLSASQCIHGSHDPHNRKQ